MIEGTRNAGESAIISGDGGDPPAPAAFPPAADRWVRRFHHCGESAVRLICFSHAGGSATYYFPYSQALAPDVEVLAIQYPGRQDRRGEPFIDSIAGLADGISGALSELEGPPFAFFGHSMGAIVAFEVAQYLRCMSRPTPLRLFVSGRRAPSRPPRPSQGSIHLGDDASIVDELRRVGGTDASFLGDPELLAGILPVTRNDYRAIETYVWSPAPPLDCPITALIGDGDPQTTVAEASAWEAHCMAGFDLRVFAGAHFYLDAHRAEVIDTIRAALPPAARG